MIKKDVYLRFVMIMAIVLVLAACAGKERVIEGDVSFKYQVNNVHVIYGDALNEEKTARLDKLKGKSMLADEIQFQLQSANRFQAAGDTKLDVTVTNFRIRSGASVFWLGMMAGVDVIDVSVAVVQNGQTIKTVTTGISTGLGGLAYASQDKRMKRMVDGLARRVLYEL